MKLDSPAFSHHASIPPRHTCEGDDLAPPLRWSGVPSEAASLVLIVDDPDAPDPAAPKTTWVHWLVYDMSPKSNGIGEGGTPLPAGSKHGLNDWQRTGYGGPCPPIGRHRYFFKLYALDTTLAFAAPPNKAALEQAMQGHVLASAELVGTYAKMNRR